MEFVQGCTLVELSRACLKASEAMPIGLALRAVHDVALARTTRTASSTPAARGSGHSPRRRREEHHDDPRRHHKLLDFGIAKSGGRSLTAVGSVRGTTGYMSPEHVRGEPLDTRSDLFSLGVVAHECLTGYRLFSGNTPEEVMAKTLTAPIEPPSKLNPAVPRALDAVGDESARARQGAPLATGVELARELEKAAGGELWPPRSAARWCSGTSATGRSRCRRLSPAWPRRRRVGHRSGGRAIHAAKSPAWRGAQSDDPRESQARRADRVRRTRDVAGEQRRRGDRAAERVRAHGSSRADRPVSEMPTPVNRASVPTLDEEPRTVPAGPPPLPIAERPTGPATAKLQDAAQAITSPQGVAAPFPPSGHSRRCCAGRSRGGGRASCSACSRWACWALE